MMGEDLTANEDTLDVIQIPSCHNYQTYTVMLAIRR